MMPRKTLAAVAIGLLIGLAAFFLYSCKSIAESPLPPTPITADSPPVPYDQGDLITLREYVSTLTARINTLEGQVAQLTDQHDESTRRLAADSQVGNVVRHPNGAVNKPTGSSVSVRKQPTASPRKPNSSTSGRVIRRTVRSLPYVIYPKGYNTCPGGNCYR